MFVDVIKTAVAAVLNDGGFRLASVPVTTTTALNTATQLVDWMSQSNNREELDVFAVKVRTHLRNCLPRRIATFRKARREVMWRSYYKLRTSPSFQSLWKEFVFKSVSVDAHPIFYQYVTDQAFQAVMEETLALEMESLASIAGSESVPNHDLSNFRPFDPEGVGVTCRHCPLTSRLRLIDSLCLII